VYRDYPLNELVTCGYGKLALPGDMDCLCMLEIGWHQVVIPAELAPDYYVNEESSNNAGGSCKFQCLITWKGCHRAVC
jgi:hypothetical protein